MNIRTYTCALSLGLATSATGVFAAEEGVPAQPPQTHDIRSAELPPMPGFYYGLAYGYRKVRSINNADGDPIFADTDATERVIGTSALYVFPEKYFDGTLGVYGVTTWQSLSGRPGGPIPPVDTSNEWVDVTVGAVWSKANYRLPEGPPMGPPPGYAYAFGLQATIPGGDASLGSLVVSPNAAFTYRTDPILLDGTEFSIRGTYNHVTERDSGLFPGTRYKDGDYIAADFAITERYRNFTFGLAGTYMKQIEDDKAGAGYPGMVAGRMEELALGGVLNIDLGPTSAIKMKYTKGVSAKSMSQGNLLAIQFVSKF